MTTPAPVRANRDGYPCPPWCVTDHDRFSFHGSSRVTVEAPRYRSCHVRAIQFAYGGPDIQVAADGIIRVPADTAADLAAIIEQLADATPAAHRALAAAVRKAAALATEETRDGQ